jgi:Zn-dependent membrane protease YugP
MPAVVLELEPWWMYLGFLSLQFFLAYGITIGWTWARIWLDRRHPDDLPLTTGQWTQARLAALGAGDVSVLEATARTGDVDAYMPSARVILLTKETYAKNDPSFWAVGAHEIGHALAYRGSAAFAAVQRTARLLRDAFINAAGIMMLANMWYRLPQVTTVAHGLFAAVLAFDVIVMVDEARASLVGRGLLRDDPHLTPSMRTTASLTLLAAFGTYFGAFVGRLILVLEWRIVSEAITRRGPYTPGPLLSGTSLAVAAALSALVLAWGVLWAVRRFVTRAPAPSAIRSLGAGALRGAFVLGLLYLVWDQPFRPLFVVTCIAALYSSRTTIVAVALPVAIPFVIVAFGFVMAILVLALALQRRAGAGGSVGATDTPTTDVVHEVIRVFACWPMILALWIFWLSSH